MPNFFMIIKSFPPKKTEKVIPEIPFLKSYPQKTAVFVQKSKKNAKTAAFTKNFCDSYPHFVKIAGGQPVFIHKTGKIWSMHILCMNL